MTLSLTASRQSSQHSSPHPLTTLISNDHLASQEGGSLNLLRKIKIMNLALLFFSNLCIPLELNSEIMHVNLF